MATAAQVLANRLNAQKSTGPRTPEGKAIVAQNAVKHGLSGRLDVIQGEDQAEFDRHRAAMLGELAPVGPMESMLAERVVSLSWRLQRVERLQNEVFDALLADRSSPLARLAESLLPKGADRLEGGPEGEDDLTLGRAVIKDFSNSRVLDRLLMYERRIEHSLYRTMAELQRLRLPRELDGPAEKRAAAASSLKSPVSGGGGQASALQTSRFRLNTSGNTSGQPDESCKTKPISPAPSEEQVPCGTGVMTPEADCAVEKTKPISEGEVPCSASVGVARA